MTVPKIAAAIKGFTVLRLRAPDGILANPTLPMTHGIRVVRTLRTLVRALPRSVHHGLSYGRDCDLLSVLVAC